MTNIYQINITFEDNIEFNIGMTDAPDRIGILVEDGVQILITDEVINQISITQENI